MVTESDDVLPPPQAVNSNVTKTEKIKISFFIFEIFLIDLN
jgi:hypothetical protein